VPREARFVIVPWDRQAIARESVSRELVERVSSTASALARAYNLDLDAHGYPKSARPLVWTAFAFLCYQWVDRVAFKELGTARDVLMDSVREKFLKEAELSLILRPDATAEGLEDELDAFLREFARYGPSEPGRPLDGTLYYEFGRLLSVAADVENDAFAVARGSELGASAFTLLDPVSLIRTQIPRGT
jgi:hypothetical protein